MMRKIAVITGARSDYGLLHPLLRLLARDQKVNLQLLVTGMHLSQEFGLTYKEIEKDGLKINEKIPIFLSSDTSTGISKTMAEALIGFSGAYNKLKPDIVVVLGDRFEIFSAVVAAMIARIPVAHIGGGDSSEGAIDEAMRHSITKMSHLHFTITDEHRQRVIQLGEDQKRVFNVGAPGLDSIRELDLLSKKELEEKLRFRFAKRNLLITFHSCTLEPASSRSQFNNLLTVLDSLKDTRFIFTKPNADIEGRVIADCIDSYVHRNKHKAVAFVSMGRIYYLSAMRYVDAVVGNSSSGILEAPSFKIGTINIGDRQMGRIKTESIIDCQPTITDIRKAIQRLYSREHQKLLKNVKNPYDCGGAAVKMAAILRSVKIKNILKKHFYRVLFNPALQK